jgi:hypothetical protein
MADVTCEEDVNAPVSWCCVDCGVNTGPGCSTRAEIWAAYSEPNRNGEHVGQMHFDHTSEICRVRNTIWERAGIEDFGGCLCIGCLEKRLGRRLKPKDFDRSHAFNDPRLPCTERLRKRRQ